MAEERNIHILVVDDDPALLRMMRLALVSQGFQVTVAEDALSGLGKFDAADFDLLILDLQMPRMDGRAMFRELRTRGYGLPVLILSAYGAEAARQELNANAAMSKPFDTDALIERVQSLVPGVGTWPVSS